MKWIRLKANCPICGGSRKQKDCRQSPDSGLFFCHSDQADAIGYVFRGYDAYGFGIWQDAADAEAFAAQSSADRKLQRQERQQQAEARKKAEIAREMPEGERDRWHRKLINSLALSQGDRGHLEGRGFKPEEISGYRSIAQWQKISPAFPANLPGRSQRGTLVAKHEGILCPIPNESGAIVAFQIRRQNFDEGRYAWLSSQGATAKIGGEMPIGVYPAPGGKAEAIWLCDSPAIKAHLASLRLDAPAVGAANGNFAGSPTLSQRALSALADRYGCKRLMLALDAGDVANPAVVARWQSQYAYLSGLGYSCEFAWWGQKSKEDFDIDELPIEQISAIQMLSLAEFESIARECGGLPSQESEPAKPVAKAEADSQIDSEILKKYKKLTALTEKPWKVVSQSKISLAGLDLEPGAIYIVSSAKGTGKTEAVQAILPRFRNVYAWFSRIALGREECHRLDLTWREDMGSFQGFLKVGFCSNSAYKFAPKHLQTKGLLLVDECDQVFEHNFSKPCNKQGIRPMILSSLKSQLEAAVSGEGMALFMSADVSDRDVEYIKSLAPEGVSVRVIVNEYKPQLGRLFFDMAKKPDKQIARLIEKLEAGIPCFVIDDIKDGVRGCKSIAELVRSLHPEWVDKIIEINSETSCTEGVQQFLTNINEASKETLLICCSPSVVSGISIQNGRFKRGVFGFFNGILTVSQASQAIGRVRGAEEIEVWAAERGLLFASNRSDDYQEIHRYYQENYEANAKHLLSFDARYNPLSQEFDSPHFWMFCKSEAYRNICQHYLRELLRLKFEEEGYEVIDWGGGNDADEVIERSLKETKERIEIARARAIAQAETLSEDELFKAQNSLVRPPIEVQHQIEKTLIEKRFGKRLIEMEVYQHPNGEEFKGCEAIVLKNKRDVYLSRLENFYLFQADLSEAAARDRAAEDRQLRQSQGRFAGDIRWNAEKRKCLEDVGLGEVLEAVGEVPLEAIEAVGKRARKMAKRLKNALALSLGKMSDRQIVGELLHRIGLGFVGRSRELCREALDRAMAFVAHKIERKMESETHPSPEILNEASREGCKGERFAVSYSQAIEKPVFEEVSKPLQVEAVAADPIASEMHPSLEDLNEAREGGCSTESLVASHSQAIEERDSREIEGSAELLLEVVEAIPSEEMPLEVLQAVWRGIDRHIRERVLERVERSMKGQWREIYRLLPECWEFAPRPF